MHFSNFYLLVKRLALTSLSIFTLFISVCTNAQNNNLSAGVNGANTNYHASQGTDSQNRIIVTGKSSRKLLRKIKQGNAYLVDVRTPEEYNTKHLEYAKNINFKSKNFVDEISKLEKDKPIYLYCRSGHRSGNAADTLQTLGFKSAYSIGGLDSLAKAGLPTEK